MLDLRCYFVTCTTPAPPRTAAAAISGVILVPVTMAKKPSRVVAAARAPGKCNFVRIQAVTPPGEATSDLWFFYQLGKKIIGV